MGWIRLTPKYNHDNYFYQIVGGPAPEGYKFFGQVRTPVGVIRGSTWIGAEHGGLRPEAEDFAIEEEFDLYIKTIEVVP